MLDVLEKQNAARLKALGEKGKDGQKPTDRKKGILDGPATTAALIAELPELGQLKARQICALVGVVPMNSCWRLF